MPRYRTQITIARPAENVFEYISNVATWPRWMNVEDVRLIDGDVLRVGSRSEAYVREGSTRMPAAMEITGLEPGRRIAFRTTSGPIEWAGEWEVVPIDATSTKVQAQGTMTFRGLRRLFAPFMSGEIQKSEEAELVKLRQNLEAE